MEQDPAVHSCPRRTARVVDAVLVLLPLLARPGLARERRPQEGAAIGFIALNWLVTLTAPGVGNCYALEHRWFPNYDMLDAVDKASIGLGLVRQALLDANNLLVPLLALLALHALPAWRDRTSQP